MKKKYTKKQIVEAIAYWKKRLNESGYFLHDTSYDGKIETVGDLKRALMHFRDSDRLCICDSDGVPDSEEIKAIWNSEAERTEFAPSGSEDVEDNVCYIRLSDMR